MLAGGLYTPASLDRPPMLLCFLGNLVRSEAWRPEDLGNKKDDIWSTFPLNDSNLLRN